MSRLAGLESRTTAPAVEALAHRLALNPGLDVPLGTLSRGNLRKVILAQALMRPVDLMVMDEPFTALDDTASAELAAIVEEHLAQGCTFLIASHSDTLDDLGRSLTLRAGRLVDAFDTGTSSGTGLLSIELGGPQPSTWSGQRLHDGTIRYLVPVRKGEVFLHDALAAGSQVLRLNPIDDP
jgi:energy-coupling factor transporter ATP-binding protein EcfA2